MATHKRKKFTVAQRMFKKLYLPFIKSHVLNLSAVSYLTLSDIGDDWGEKMPWNAHTADEIVLQSKMFFQNEISSDTASLHNPDVLDELAGYIIDHLMPYFMRAPQFQASADAAREYLTKKIQTHNVVLIRARIHRQATLEKNLRRAARVAAVSESSTDATPEQRMPRQGRPRISGRVVVDDSFKFCGSVYTKPQKQR